MAQTRTTFQGKVRSSGGSAKGNATAGVTVLSVMFSFDPTATTATNVKIGSSATSGEDLTLPKGAVPISITTKAVATGGTNPTVDIGTSADNDGLFNELDADANNTTTVASGALVTTTGLAADSVITGMKGASAATGGTYTGILTYYCVDDGKDS